VTPFEIPGSVIRHFNHVASFKSLVAMIYSASIVDKAAIGYKDAFQKIESAHRVKM